MPDVKNKWLTFDNFKFQLRIPYVIYADFECVLPKVSGCLNNPEASSTNIISKHVPCGYSYLIVGPDGRSTQSPKIYRGENAVSNFLESLLAEAEIISKTLRKVEKIDMSKEQEQEFQNAVNCHICGKVLGTDRVRDHDHLQKTNNYRGAAHSTCNLNYQLSWKIPVVFHNLRGYDSHLIVQELGKLKGKRINCIANNMEKYISFSIEQLQFLDSLQFLPTSLQKLVENLSPQKFVIIREHFKNDEIPLLLRKGVYPYEYMDSFKKFNETHLPPREAFFSNITKEELSVSDYQHAQMVWESFKLQNLGEYHDLYLKTDCLLLADVFENFRALCMDFYKLDPCHMFTAPGLAWQACLRMTQVKMELLTDPTMHLFLEKGIRGGVSMISKRYSRANNKYLSDYDPTLPSKYIMYFDKNNLYGWAMVQPLPLMNFKWQDPNNMDEKA
ncbi:hypothetical protein X975_19061, partial [Stegodyphus mimosarum]